MAKAPFEIFKLPSNRVIGYGMWPPFWPFRTAAWWPQQLPKPRGAGSRATRHVDPAASGKDPQAPCGWCGRTFTMCVNAYMILRMYVCMHVFMHVCLYYLWRSLWEEVRLSACRAKRRDAIRGPREKSEA